MGPLGAHLEKVRHEFPVLTQVDATEPRDAPATMTVHMKQCDAVLECGGHRLADRMRPHHGADRGVFQVVVICHRRVAVDEDGAIAFADGESSFQETHAFMGKGMWASKIAAHLIK